MVDKKTILEGYAQGNLEGRKDWFAKLQIAGKIDKSLEYSDENYFDSIYGGNGLQGISGLTDVPPGQTPNEFLINVLNIIGVQGFSKFNHKFTTPFDMFVRETIQQGDAVQINYTDVGAANAYNKDVVIPTTLKGGDKVKQQTISINYNTDRQQFEFFIPMKDLYLAYTEKLMLGFRDGSPESLFTEQIENGFNIWKLGRGTDTLACIGGISSKPWLFGINTTDTPTFKPTPTMFKKVAAAPTDTDSMVKYFQSLYAVSKDLEVNYSTLYNEQGFTRLLPIKDQILILDQSLYSLWKTSLAVIFNSEKIDPENVYKKVLFMKLPDTSRIQPDGKTNTGKILSIIMDEEKAMHYPMLDLYTTQLFAKNLSTYVALNYWVRSGIDYSKVAITFTL